MAESLLSVCLLSTELYKYGGCSFTCMICHTGPTNSLLLRCSGCKLALYCSKEHQVQHWKKHKRFCKFIRAVLIKRQVNHIYDTADGSSRQILNTGFSLRKMFFKTYNKPMEQEDDSLIFYPFVCNVCELFKQGKMISCSECSAVVYCSAEHKMQDLEAHTMFCATYKRCVEYDKKCQQTFLIEVRIRSMVNLPRDMQAFTENFVDLFTLPTENKAHGIWYISNWLSTPLSIIHVIEATKLLEGVKDTLTIHVVSPQLADCNAWWAWETIFHYFTVLKQINLFYIAPIMYTLHKFYMTKPSLICSECKSTRILKFDYSNKNYEDFVQTNPSNPDLIISVNHPVVGPTLPDHINGCEYYESLFRFKKAIIAVTSYGESCGIKKLNVLKRLSNKHGPAEFLIENQLNPFKSLIPLFHMKYEFGIDAHSNKYITVLKV